jgi:Domain of unknown function (DUF4136)
MRAPGMCMIVLALAASATGAIAATHSDFNKHYNLEALKTFDFKPQRRISRDPIADNHIWGDEIRSAIAENLTEHGLAHESAGEPDFLVAFYVGLRERYDVRYVDYGYPFWGPGWRSWWGWPRGYDAWAVPYTESTLIIDVVDARTNQLVWRGYNRDDINLGKPDKDFVHAVDEVLKKFYGDAKKSAPKATAR